MFANAATAQAGAPEQFDQALPRVVDIADAPCPEPPLVGAEKLFGRRVGVAQPIRLVDDKNLLGQVVEKFLWIERRLGPERCFGLDLKFRWWRAHQAASRSIAPEKKRRM